jgi:hypothetical protein
MPFAAAAPARRRPASSTTTAAPAVIASQSTMGTSEPLPPSPLARASETASASRPSIEIKTPPSSRRPRRRPATRAETKARTPMPPAAMLCTSASDASASAAA